MHWQLVGIKSGTDCFFTQMESLCQYRYGCMLKCECMPELLFANRRVVDKLCATVAALVPLGTSETTVLLGAIRAAF